MEKLTQEKIKFYKEYGYLIISDVLTSDEVEDYKAVIRKCANKDFAAIMNPDRLDFLIAQCHELIDVDWNLLEKLKFLSDCQEAVNYTTDLMKNHNAVYILETLQDEEVVGLMSQMLFKEANSKYASQAWNPHQDNTYPRNENGKYITTNFFLEDADIENGTLYVYPGSHKGGLYEADMTRSYRESSNKNPGNTIDDGVLDKFEKVTVNFKKGDMIVLHGNLIHGSYPNLSTDRNRPLLSCSYISSGEDFISGKNAQRKVINLKGN